MRLRFFICVVSSQVIHAYCNHILALYEACKFSIFDSKSTKDLCPEDDEHENLACTFQLQKWHKKGHGGKISAQLVMEVTIYKTILDENKSREGVKCLMLCKI